MLGGDSVLRLLCALFCVPELAGRSLEEVDERFEARLWAWQLKLYKASWIGHQITQLDEHNLPNEEDIMVRMVL